MTACGNTLFEDVESFKDLQALAGRLSSSKEESQTFCHLLSTNNNLLEKLSRSSTRTCRTKDRSKSFDPAVKSPESSFSSGAIPPEFPFSKPLSIFESSSKHEASRARCRSVSIQTVNENFSPPEKSPNLNDPIFPKVSPGFAFLNSPSSFPSFASVSNGGGLTTALVSVPPFPASERILRSSTEEAGGPNLLGGGEDLNGNLTTSAEMESSPHFVNSQTLGPLLATNNNPWEKLFPAPTLPCRANSVSSDSEPANEGMPPFKFRNPTSILPASQIGYIPFVGNKLIQFSKPLTVYESTKKKTVPACEIIAGGKFKGGKTSSNQGRDDQKQSCNFNFPPPDNTQILHAPVFPRGGLRFSFLSSPLDLNFPSSLPNIASVSKSPLPASERNLRSSTGKDTSRILDTPTEMKYSPHLNLRNDEELNRSEDASSEKEGSINLLEDEETRSEESSKVISLTEEKLPDNKTQDLNSIGECQKQGTVWCKPFALLKKVTLEEVEVEVIADIPCMGKNVTSGSEEGFANNVVKLDNVENQNSINGAGGKSNQSNIQTRLFYPCPTCKNCKMSSLANWKKHMRRIHKSSDPEFSGEMVEGDSVKKSKSSPEIIDPFDFSFPREKQANHTPRLHSGSPANSDLSLKSNRPANHPPTIYRPVNSQARKRGYHYDLNCFRPYWARPYWVRPWPY